jgi:CRP-like cAMP-binding protein
MHIQNLIDHFARYQALKAGEIDLLQSILVEKRIKRRQFILQEGEVCKHYNFVVEGCFKMYKIDTKGSAHNLQFSVENGWIADIGSFHSEKASELNIEALEQSIILQIAKEDLITLYTHFQVFDRIFRVLVESAFINLQKRVLQNISATAEERYLDFLHIYPHLFNRISNVQIASFIGVTPEFLSKVRKEISSK